MLPKKKKKWKLSTQAGILMCYVTSVAKCGVSTVCCTSLSFWYLTSSDVSFRRRFTCYCNRHKVINDPQHVLYLNIWRDESTNGGYLPVEGGVLYDNAQNRILFLVHFYSINPRVWAQIQLFTDRSTLRKPVFLVYVTQLLHNKTERVLGDERWTVKTLTDLCWDLMVWK